MNDTPTPTVDPLFEINKRFTYHPPHGTQPARYVAIREKAKEFAVLINDTTPESREKSLALTKLEEAVMWANASIARNELAPPLAPTDYRQRVIEEKRELDIKLQRLSDFLATPESRRMVGSDEEFKRLEAQKVYMRSYSNVLGERIADFKK